MELNSQENKRGRIVYYEYLIKKIGDPGLNFKKNHQLLIFKSLIKSNHNVRQSSKILGMSERNLRILLKQSSTYEVN